MGSFPPPPPFRLETNIGSAEWLDPLLRPHEGFPPVVGFIVPSAYEAYAHLLHPARRFFGHSFEQSVPLRWSEIAATRAKTLHSEVQLQALIDNRDEFITTTGRRSAPAAASGSRRTSVSNRPRRSRSSHCFGRTPRRSMRPGSCCGTGTGTSVERSTTSRGEPSTASPSLRTFPPSWSGRTWAFRHYLVFRGPLDALPKWFEWRMEGPNYFWPDDRAWIVATEIDGFSTYVGAPREGIDRVLDSPLLEALPSALAHRFDGIGDLINGAPP
jgi:hypothetical protein